MTRGQSEARELFGRLVEANPAVQLLLDPETGAIVEANPAACRFYGLSRDELTRRRIFDINTLSEAEARQAMARTLGEGQTCFEFVHRAAGGEVRNVEVHGSRISLDGRDLLHAIVRDITPHKLTEALAEKQLIAMRGSMDGMALLDAAGRYLFVNEAHARVYGFEHPEDLLGSSWRVLYGPEELTRISQQVMPQVAREGRWRGEAVGRRRDGSTFDQEISLTRLEDGGLVCVVRDVSERKRAERMQAALFRIADTTGRIRDIDDLYAALHGIVGGLMDARNFYIALHDPGSDEISFPYFVDAAEPPPPPQPFGRGLTEYVLRTGEPLLVDPRRFAELQAAGEVELVGGESVDWLGVPLKSGEQVFGVLAVQSYSEASRYTAAERDLLTFVSQHIANAIERTRAEAQIRRLAYHDALTGLPNRLLFGDRLEMAIAQAIRGHHGLAVAFLDLDRFKVINDSMGHRMGDQLLKGVAARLAAGLRDADTVARLGGDEFTILLSRVDGPLEAARVAERVLEEMRRPFEVEGYDLFVTASVGVSVFPDDGQDVETLVRSADTAMYRAKDQGRDGFELFAPAMNASAQRRRAHENGLRRALAQEELELHYQPVVDVRTGRVRGVEALLRWPAPGGYIPPAEFLPVAELTGLVVPIGPWVLRTACRQLATWHRLGFSDLTVAVNLSARQLQHPTLVDTVSTVLAEAGLAARFLELEVTETNAMQNFEATAEVLRDLADSGVRISIDDFGVGYSSLSYLKRLPVHMVKIDQSFIRDSPGDRDDAAIATAVVEMAHALELQVVAEGVESEEQRAFLHERGCDRMQGYLISPPLPAPELEDWLSRPARDLFG